MDPLYYFILAAVIASFGISIAVRKAFSQIVEGKLPLHKVQTKLMVSVALVETIPILLLVLGFMNIEEAELSPLVVILIVGAAMLFNFLINWFRYRDSIQQVEQDSLQKQQLSTTFQLSIFLMNAIPIVAIIATTL
ncbi:ATP synthase subunit C [Bacillus oleivorans]|uniref:ATP synthase subunit C n=1 Tax=Bacillus oleivorans TaxID=1448271 RepID=A0A285CH43_9BACI|nr:hypothetical protein [Bacillus oleivorans]SNX66917.1 ATP synthase subunit C [Bacillus oleivorans]